MTLIQLFEIPVESSHPEQRIRSLHDMAQVSKVVYLSRNMLELFK
jgi:hypothetical protein